MPDKLISVNTAREYVQTLIADPILKSAVNYVLNNVPAVQCVDCPMKKEVDKYAKTMGEQFGL